MPEAENEFVDVSVSRTSDESAEAVWQEWR